MEFRGEFETHLTIDANDPAGLICLRRYCQTHSRKFTHIVLQRGDTPSQPMVTYHGSGTLSEELIRAADEARGLASQGYTVARTKIEVSPFNDDVPVSDAEAAHDPPYRYFEHHVKLLLDPCTDFSALADLAIRHGAHLSRNALRTRSDGFCERFVTQRARRVGRIEARRRLEDLLEALATLTILDIEEEYVVYDSNLPLDDGWL